MLDRSEGAERELRLPAFSMKADEVGYERPLVARFTGKLGGQTENLEGELKLDRLPASFEGLAPEAWPKLSGTMTMKRVPLAVARDYLPVGSLTSSPVAPWTERRRSPRRPMVPG